MRDVMVLPNGELATDILTPLMAHADILKQGGCYAQSRLLWALIEDVDRQLVEVFGQIASQAPDVRVKLPSSD